MYRKQLTWQRILCFAAIAACGVVFLYALGLMTDQYDSLYYTMTNPKDVHKTMVKGSWIYYDMQPFNRDLLAYAIVALLFGCLLFITGTHKRRKYYFGNVFSTCAFFIISIAGSVWGHIQLTAFRAQFLTIDFKTMEKMAKMWKKPYYDSTFWFDIHYVVFGLLLAVSFGLVANLIWKKRLMRAEQQLIDEGRKAGQ
ncbi:MAG: hypothetical protein E7324_06490 [Clostridiales bacterium]|nr:hypothetical protein [Clostridiales bacterium]